MIQIRVIKVEDVRNGFLEVLEEFSGMDLFLKEPERAEKLILNLPTNHYIIVGESAGKIVGTGTVYIEQKLINDGRKAGHIEDVAVLFGYRDQGIGTKIMNRLLEICQENKCYKCVLSCNHQNISYYERFGMKHTSNLMRINFQYD